MHSVTSDFEGGVKISGEMRNNMRFADGTTLVCSSKEELLDILQRTMKARADSYRGLATAKHQENKGYGGAQEQDRSQ